MYNALVAPVTSPLLTLEQLAQHDGLNGAKTYTAVNGTVFDVSGSEMFETTYTSWAGKDATVSLGLMSLEEKDAGRIDWGILGAKEWQTASNWEQYFTEKYIICGRVAEFDRFLVYRESKNAGK